MIKKKSPEVITIYECHIYELRGEELYESRLSQISRYICFFQAGPDEQLCVAFTFIQPHNIWWKFYRKVYIFFEDRHIIGKSCDLQFANLLEKNGYKKIYVFINPGKYLPLWKDETTLLKLHAQLTYKQNAKKILQTNFVVLLCCLRCAR